MLMATASPSLYGLARFPTSVPVPDMALDPSSPNQRDNLHGTLVSTLADPCDCTVTASAAFDILEESSGAIDIVGQLQRDNGAWVPFWYSEVTGGSVSIHLINMGRSEERRVGKEC